MTLTSGQPKLPLRLGRYEVGATLAGGGMARVLVGRTWNDDGSEQLVALKVIHDSLEDQEEFVHMFLDEGRLLSRIVHPNVVQTLEVGVNGSMRYIAMELLLGRSLFDVWELGDRTGKRLPVDLAVTGMRHRDLRNGALSSSLQARAVKAWEIASHPRWLLDVALRGKPHGFGLEAGSKPELLAVLALTNGGSDTPIICNGFKDAEFIEMAMLAQKIGRNIIPVVEKYTELELILHYAEKVGVRPNIGMRVKLAARGGGRWQSSGGYRSKIGRAHV